MKMQPSVAGALDKEKIWPVEMCPRVSATGQIQPSISSHRPQSLSLTAGAVGRCECSPPPEAYTREAGEGNMRLMQRLSRSLSRFENQDIKTQPRLNHIFMKQNLKKVEP